MESDYPRFSAKQGCLYAILGVRPDATSRQIRIAYKKQALKVHPDKQKTDEERKQAHEKFARLNNANEILSDSEKRKAYDLFVRQSRRGHGASRESPNGADSRSNPSPPPSQESPRPHQNRHANSSRTSRSSNKNSSKWQQWNEARGNDESRGGHRYSSSSSGSWQQQHSNSSRSNSSSSSSSQHRYNTSSSSSSSSRQSSSQTNNDRSSSQPRQSRKQQVFGTCQNGEPCKRCIRQGWYCYQHTHQDPQNAQNTNTSDQPKRAAGPSSSPRGGSKAYGMTQNGQPCKRCMKQGGYCYQHEDQRRSGNGATSRDDKTETNRGQRARSGKDARGDKQRRHTNHHGGCRTFGVTKSGAPCKRCLKQGGYCYQHLHQKQA